MKFKYILLGIGITLFPLQSEFVSAASRVAIVATVNGEMISTLDIDKLLKHEMIVRKMDKKDVDFQEKSAALRSELINALIEEKLLLLDAKKQSISINDNRLNFEIQENIKQSGLSEAEFYKQVTDTGLSKKDYAEKLRKTLTTQDLFMRNIFRKIIISDADILEHYQSRGGNLFTEVEVALILYPSVGVASKYGTDLKTGKSNFKKIAEAVSVGPNADTGGSLGLMSMMDLAPPIQFQVQKLDEGQVSNIFSLGDQEAQIMLIDKGKSSDKPLAVMDEATYQQITENLRQQKIGTRIVEYIEQLKEKAIINIRD